MVGSEYWKDSDCKGMGWTLIEGVGKLALRSM